MHITIVANGFQEDYIYNLLNHLIDKVDRLDFIGSPIYDRQKLDSRIVFYEFRADQEGKRGWSKAWGMLKYYRKLLNHLAKTDSKIVHIQWLRFDFIEGVLMSWIMKRMGKKIIYTAHNILPHNAQGVLVEKKFMLLYRMPNEILVHTSFIKDQIVNRFHIQPEKIHVAHHGVYKRDEDPTLTRHDARALLNLRQDSTVILFFGIIQAYKGFDTLTRSIELLGNNSNLEILVAGRVAKEYRDTFESLVDQTENKNYTYLLKYINDEEVERCFKAADVTVLPYKEASQSGVLFMSYTYGVPVIAPDLGGFSEDIVTAKTGYLFEPNNPESLAACILQYKEDWAQAGGPEKQYIVDFAHNNYSWDASCNKIVEVYKAAELS